MTPGVRKLALTAHVTASVGWLGAVVAFLALAITARTSADVRLAGGVYLAMELTVRLVIVPLSVASLVTGLVQSLGTAWGLLRHYWVLFKLVLNVFATVLLLLYLPSVDHAAAIAGAGPATEADLAELRDPTHVLHAGAALLVLLAATVLAVYKPRGMTKYGWRRQRARRSATVA